MEEWGGGGGYLKVPAAYVNILQFHFVEGKGEEYSHLRLATVQRLPRTRTAPQLHDNHRPVASASLAAMYRLVSVRLCQHRRKKGEKGIVKLHNR
eukprot:gene8289-5808_t